MKNKANSPQDVLDDIVSGVVDDVKAIREEQKAGKLGHGSAQDLCRYGAWLLTLIEHQNKESAKEREKMAGMTTEELEQFAKDLLKKK